MEHRNYFETNKSLWNQKTLIHKTSAFYDVEGFKAGNTALNTIELAELGSVKNKTLLHLQCHFGMDTLSWSRLGAITTGVDLSDEAIKYAKELSNELAVKSDFVCCNVYDLKENLNTKFDIVFTSYGTIGWLPDLNKWAEVISHFLKPNGIFYMVDFHPILWMFDNDFKFIQYPYHNDAVIEEELEGTYADKAADIKHKSYGWNHSISEILNALISNGITIEHFNEFNYSPYNCFNNTIKGEDGYYKIKGLENKIPMLYSIKGKKN